MNRVEAYAVCKERGHKASEYVIVTNPPMNQCEFCGTVYRYEWVLVECDIPVEGSSGH